MSGDLPETELLDARQAAALLGIGRTPFFKLNKRKNVPAGIAITTKIIRWRRRDLLRWIEAGCPRREEFERITASQPQASQRG